MQFQFEFIEHIIGFILLTLMPTTTKIVQESNVLSFPHLSDLSRVRHTGTYLTETEGNT